MSPVTVVPNMPKTTRTFIAVAIPTALGEKLTRLQEQLGRKLNGVRWTCTLPFHLTLAFLGDVLETDLNAICKATAAAVETIKPFQVCLRGVGAFPDASRPRVIWAGLGDADQAPLLNLQNAVVKAVSGTGYRPDDQRFNAHVTLGRIKPERGSRPVTDLSPILANYQEWSGGEFMVREVTTFESVLLPEGPAYTPLARAALARKNSASSA